MMGFVVFISFLLIFKFVEDISGELIHAQTYRGVSLYGPNLDRPLEQCSVEHNGINYGVYPKLNLTGAKFSGSNRYCTFFIESINFDHAGEWKIHTIWGSDKYSDEDFFSTPTPNLYSDYTMQVNQEDDELVFRGVTGADGGSYATVHFKDYFNKITKCYIVKETYNGEIRYVLSDNGNGTLAGLELYGKCGVRIPINNETEGDWKLVQESGDYKIRTGIITVEPHSIIKSSKELHESWFRGSTNMKIRINKYEINWYCELERPNGEVISLINSECEYTVKKVRRNHAGIWKIRYASKPSTTIVEQNIIVDVIDPKIINATVTTSRQKYIRILCQTNVNEIKYCLLTTPSGAVMNMSAEDQYKKYMYFGSGFHTIPQRHLAECGITIFQPSNDDYGLWKCTIKDAQTHKIINASVSTMHLATKKINHPNISTEDVYVKLHDKFSVKCTTNTSLDYCWFESPKGRYYSVRKDRNISPHHSLHVAERLSVGVCEITIKKADETHSGYWSCGLGPTGGVEIESKVSVTITGELIHARIGDDVTLSGPHSDVPLEHCSVEHNGTIYGLYPKSNLTGATFAGSPWFCTFFMKEINFDHAGDWKIKTIWKSDKYSDELSMSTPKPKLIYINYTIHVEQENDELVFTNVIDGEDGSYTTLYFKEYFDNITTCYIIKESNHGEIRYMLNDNGDESSAGLELYDKCGVRIPINDKWRGEWTLVQESGDYKIKTGSITIGPH